MFNSLRDALVKQLDSLKSKQLFVTAIPRNVIWNTYLNSFPEGTNPLYITNTVHDCDCCKSWVRNIGTVVYVADDGSLKSIWDLDNLPEPYQTVANAMRDEVLKYPIKDIFLTNGDFRNVKENFCTSDVQPEKLHKKFEHFYWNIPSKYISNDVSSRKGSVQQSAAVIKRSLEELTLDSVELVLEFIDSKSLYRGEEYQKVLVSFKKALQDYEKATNKDAFVWSNAVATGRLLGIRNTAIGTLLINLSEGMDAQLACDKFGKVMSPLNFKRPKPVTSKKMVEKAKKRIEELGLMNSLGRRHAVLNDISVNNVIWVNKTAKAKMKDAFDELISEATVEPAKFTKAREVYIEEFVKSVLPNTKKLEILMENKHEANLMSLIAPADSTAPSLMKWKNGFSFAYNGDIADSGIKQAVKLAGGKVDGVLNCRLAWNSEGGTDRSDLDIWIKSPVGEKIGFSNMSGRCGARLDVDNQNPHGRLAVENITWKNTSKMMKGDYKIWINQYAARNSKGFQAEIEFGGETYSYSYTSPLRPNSNVNVATIHYDGANFTITHHLPCSSASQDIWGLKTKQFHEVNTFMFSPNHWEDSIGNKHYFFLIKDCLNQGNPRGFFNEFLSNELSAERKVLEALGNKMRVEYSDNQLSGLGFSNTKQNFITLKADGKPYKINFINEKSSSSIKSKAVLSNV